MTAASFLAGGLIVGASAAFALRPHVEQWWDARDARARDRRDAQWARQQRDGGRGL